MLIDGADLTCPLPAAVALLGDGTAAAGTFARIVARRNTDFAGEVSIGEHRLADLPKSIVGRHIAYAGIEPILFPGSIRDNLVYGLRHRPLAEAQEDKAEALRRLAEARRTGNPVESVAAPWIDCSLVGARDEDELDDILLELLRRVGLQEDIYRFGLSGMVDPAKHPALADGVIEARGLLRDRLAQAGASDLVEPFDAERFNAQATIAENLLFGVPTSRALIGRNLAEHAGIRAALNDRDLTEGLARMGARIAETMVEIFRGLPPGHPLFEQFSFISADELDDVEAVLRRHAGRDRPFRGDELTRMLALPLAYIEPRHRLGLLDDDLQERIVAARAACATRSRAPAIRAWSSTIQRRSARPRRSRTTCCSAA
jgi:putative ABC transport system ATP-binding protein